MFVRLRRKFGVSQKMQEVTIAVLIVEDEWLVRETIASFLRATGWEVVEAADGEAAVAVLRTNEAIDVVFTDIGLGRQLSGWDVGEAWRAADPEMPVIYTSGAVLLPERRVPGSVFFEKPYDPARVLQACASLLDR
jgi:CheY-like chemotaxis protein